MKTALKNPPDAEKLSDQESKFYMDQMQGLWDIIPIEMPNMGMGNGQNTIAFSQAFVSGNIVTLSGGPGGRVQTQFISIHRTPEGVIYLDDKGSILNKFAPQEGVVEVTNALGFKICWKKSGQAMSLNTVQPIYKNNQNVNLINAEYDRPP